MCLQFTLNSRRMLSEGFILYVSSFRKTSFNLLKRDQTLQLCHVRACSYRTQYISVRSGGLLGPGICGEAPEMPTFYFGVRESSVSGRDSNRILSYLFMGRICSKYVSLVYISCPFWAAGDR